MHETVLSQGSSPNLEFHWLLAKSFQRVIIVLKSTNYCETHEFYNKLADREMYTSCDLKIKREDERKQRCKRGSQGVFYQSDTKRRFDLHVSVQGQRSASAVIPNVLPFKKYKLSLYIYIFFTLADLNNAHQSLNLHLSTYSSTK